MLIFAPDQDTSKFRAAASYDKQDVMKQLSQLVEKQPNYRSIGHTSATFITHAVAIKLLFSPSVVAAFEKLKDPRNRDHDNFDCKSRGGNGKFTRRFFANLLLQRHRNQQVTSACTSSGWREKLWILENNAHVPIKTREKAGFTLEMVDFDVEDYRDYIDISEMTFDATYERLPLFFKGDNCCLNDENGAFMYLVFGLETLRNPSSFIYNMMLFDLMRAGQINWEGFFRLMPVRIKGASMASRLINNMYAPYMPYAYHYESRTYSDWLADWLQEKNPWRGALYEHRKNARILLQRGHKIIKKWLRWKLREECVFVYFNQQNGVKMHEFQWLLFDYLQNAVHRWVGIDLKND